MVPVAAATPGSPLSRAPLVAITDDDCLPSPGWLEQVLAAFHAGADVVQGTVEPDVDDEVERRWWDHTVNILGPSPWFETSNVAYRRTFLDSVGGFDETDPLTAQHGGGRAFGEDAVLGARVVAAGAVRAVGRRCGGAAPDRAVDLPPSAAGVAQPPRFPGLVLRSQVGTESLYGGVFLNRETARFDLALAGVLVAAITRRPVFLLAGVPWARSRWWSIRERTPSRIEALGRLAQRSLIEAVGFVSLVEGSVEHRRLVL